MHLKPRRGHIFVILCAFLVGLSIANIRTSNPKLHDYLMLALSTALMVLSYLSLNLIEEEARGEAAV